MLEQNIQTQRGLIIRTMMKKPKTWVLASEFCGGNGSFPFIGYKAPKQLQILLFVH